MKQLVSFLGAVSLLAFAAPAYSGWFGPSNFEECMLDKMKGQPQSMMNTAHKYCAKAFHQEQEILYQGRIKKEWNYSAGSFEVTITENDTEYEVTKGKFSFADKKCDEVKDDDFKQTKIIEFRSGKKVDVFLFPPPVCMKTLQLWGQYK